MAGICCFLQPNYHSLNHRPILRSMHGVKCFSGTPDKTRTPQFLKFAVSGVTEFLRLFSSSVEDRSDRVRYEQREEISVSDIDDIVTILKADYENAYFVTGIFTSEIYVKDCIFEDPTISFRGTELYSRNLRLLVPFFEYPSIRLQKIEKETRVEGFQMTQFNDQAVAFFGSLSISQFKPGRSFEIGQLCMLIDPSFLLHR